MTTGVDKGHTISGVGYGAVGIVKESEETRVIGNLVIKYLHELGEKTIDCTVDKATSVRESLNQICNNANKQHLDIFTSIHLNASDGNGHGVEIYTYGGKKFVQAERVLKNISDLGYRNRGIKDGSHLAVVRGTKAPSMLIECFFCDNKEDVNRYNPDKMARAISEGITGKKLKSNEKQEVKTKMELKEINTIVHGEKISTKGYVADGNNYIPIRFLEELGYKLDWDNKNKAVVIEYKKK